MCLVVSLGLQLSDLLNREERDLSCKINCVGELCPRLHGCMHSYIFTSSLQFSVPPLSYRLIAVSETPFLMMTMQNVATPFLQTFSLWNFSFIVLFWVQILVPNLHMHILCPCVFPLKVRYPWSHGTEYYRARPFWYCWVNGLNEDWCFLQQYR